MIKSYAFKIFSIRYKDKYCVLEIEQIRSVIYLNTNHERVNLLIMQICNIFEYPQMLSPHSAETISKFAEMIIMFSIPIMDV